MDAIRGKLFHCLPLSLPSLSSSLILKRVSKAFANHLLHVMPFTRLFHNFLLFLRSALDSNSVHDSRWLNMFHPIAMRIFVVHFMWVFSVMMNNIPRVVEGAFTSERCLYTYHFGRILLISLFRLLICQIFFSLLSRIGRFILYGNMMKSHKWKWISVKRTKGGGEEVMSKKLGLNSFSLRRTGKWK